MKKSSYPGETSNLMKSKKCNHLRKMHSVQKIGKTGQSPGSIIWDKLA